MGENHEWTTSNLGKKFRLASALINLNISLHSSYNLLPLKEVTRFSVRFGRPSFQIPHEILKKLTLIHCCQVLKVEGRLDSKPAAYNIAAASGMPITKVTGSSKPSTFSAAKPFSKSIPIWNNCTDFQRSEIQHSANSQMNCRDKTVQIGV